MSEGVTFLGFIMFPDHRRLKPQKVRAWRHQFSELRRAYEEGTLPLDRLDASVQGWVNHARYGDTYGLRRAILASAGIRGPRREAVS